MSTVNRSLVWEAKKLPKTKGEEAIHMRPRSIRLSLMDRQSPYQVIHVRGNLATSF